jgi:hypothetical protein
MPCSHGADARIRGEGQPPMTSTSDLRVLTAGDHDAEVTLRSDTLRDLLDRLATAEALALERYQEIEELRAAMGEPTQPVTTPIVRLKARVAELERALREACDIWESAYTEDEDTIDPKALAIRRLRAIADKEQP